MLGGGTGPSAHGTLATTCTPGPWHLGRMIRRRKPFPMNLVLRRQGQCRTARRADRDDRGREPARLKLHEDWGTTPAAIDNCLSVADDYDVQVMIHTDTLNESGFVENTIAAFKGRTIHAFHTEGAGGGHAPDIIKVAGLPNVLPSSTNPTRPYTVNTLEEHLDMLMVCHHLSTRRSRRTWPSPTAASARRRSPPRISCMIMGALFHHVLGFSQAMGRVGEVITRTWQTAHKMKLQRGSLLSGYEHGRQRQHPRQAVYREIHDQPGDLAQGMSRHIGSIEVGKLRADLVLWFAGLLRRQARDGADRRHDRLPRRWAITNASIPTPQPVHYRPMFGAFGKAVTSTSLVFVSQAAMANGLRNRLGTEKEMVAVENTRGGISKKSMIHNDATPDIQIDPETYAVVADGELLVCEPAKELPLAQRYFLF